MMAPGPETLRAGSTCWDRARRAGDPRRGDRRSFSRPHVALRPRNPRTSPGFHLRLRHTRVRPLTVRKVWLTNGGNLRRERIYLGGYEVWRRYDKVSGNWVLDDERQTLHVADDARRVCMVETLTWEDGSEIAEQNRVTRFRFQLDNHLGTACVEVDQVGAVISYEEYHPYGTSAYRAFAGEVSAKRYRYTGKERDEETSLYYHGARYYAPWLGRWTQADPAGTVDGTNLYAYVRGSPVVLVDPNGMQSKPGLTVSSESKISARDWVAKIRQSKQLPPWMKDAFSASGNVIEFKAGKAPPGAEVPEWFELVADAVQSGNWHLTTGTSTTHGPYGNDIIPDYEGKDTWGITLPREGVTLGATVPAEGFVKGSKEVTEGTEKQMLDKNAGYTPETPTRRRQDQGLIVVSNRLTATRGSDLTAELTDPDQLVSTLFHELAAHAGLRVRGETAETRHGEGGRTTKADIIQTEIEAFFGRSKVEVPYEAEAVLANAKRLEQQFAAKASQTPMRPLAETVKEAHGLRARLATASKELHAIRSQVYAIAKERY